MSKPILLLVLLPLPLSLFSINFNDALKTGLINAEVVSKGGYSGNCLEVTIQNNTNKPATIEIIPGTRFHSEKKQQQDIMITRATEILVDAKGQSTQALYGFCCQSSNAAPSKGSRYNNVSIAPDTMMRVCQFLNNNHFPSSAEQQAIWCISDDKELHRISNRRQDSLKTLLTFLSELTGKEYPNVHVEYWSDQNHPTSNRPMQLYMNFDFTVEEPGLSSLIIYDRFGTAVKPIFIDKSVDTSFNQEIEWTENIRKGVFKLRHFHNGALVQEKSITI
ncbi:MAG: hypothetical protein MRY83_02670 [Flavobacteriales bacterium]|nr:hypothetical protein [Flavobacteriales bacterium]